MAHDVFVSYASEDKTVADAVVATLEQEGIRCWVAPRDVVLGHSPGYVAELDRLVSVLAYLVTRPAFPARLLVRAARSLEQRDPTAVITALLGEA